MSIETVRVVHVPAEYAGIMDNVILEGGPSYYAPIKASRSYAKRVVACWNACAGIPTETLETGRVVVVPVEDLPDPEKLRLLADLLDKLWPDDDDPEAQTDLRKWARNIEAALSRFQQNGGEQQ